MPAGLLFFRSGLFLFDKYYGCAIFNHKAENAAGGIAIAGREKPNIIIMDVRLPER